MGHLTCSGTQKNLISIERERCFFTLSFEIPVAVLLSQWTVVGGCLWPNSSKASLRILPSLMFINNADNSDSASEHTTIFKIPHDTNMFPFVLI